MLGTPKLDCSMGRGKTHQIWIMGEETLTETLGAESEILGCLVHTIDHSTMLMNDDDWCFMATFVHNVG